MITKAQVDDFLQQRKLAFVGVSRSPRKFGNAAFRALRQAGYTVYPVHPEMTEIDGIKCVPRLVDLPEAVGGLVAMVAPERAEAVVHEAATIGIKRIWFQQQGSSDAALRACELLGIRAIHDQCVLMYVPGTSFPHRVHRFLRDVFGKRLPA